MSPFDMNDDASYQRWRDAKLENYPTKIDQIMIEVGNIEQLSPAEHQALVASCIKTNMVLYRSQVPLSTKNQLIKVCSNFGLNLFDRSPQTLHRILRPCGPNCTYSIHPDFFYERRGSIFSTQSHRAIQQKTLDPATAQGEG